MSPPTADDKHGAKPPAVSRATRRTDMTRHLPLICSGRPNHGPRPWHRRRPLVPGTAVADDALILLTWLELLRGYRDVDVGSWPATWRTVPVLGGRRLVRPVAGRDPGLGRRGIHVHVLLAGQPHQRVH